MIVWSRRLTIAPDERRRRRARSHQATNTAIRTATGVTVPVIILALLLKPVSSVLLGAVGVGEAIGVDIVDM